MGDRQDLDPKYSGVTLHGTSPRHQIGWITEHGRQIYGHFWRYALDPVTNQRANGDVPQCPWDTSAN